MKWMEKGGGGWEAEDDHENRCCAVAALMCSQKKNCIISCARAQPVLRLFNERAAEYQPHFSQ